MMFSASRMDNTLVGGYFEILGVMTGSPEGTKYNF